MAKKLPSLRPPRQPDPATVPATTTPTRPGFTLNVRAGSGSKSNLLSIDMRKADAYGRQQEQFQRQWLRQLRQQKSQQASQFQTLMGLQQQQVDVINRQGTQQQNIFDEIRREQEAVNALARARSERAEALAMQEQGRLGLFNLQQQNYAQARRGAQQLRRVNTPVTFAPGEGLFRL